MKTEDPVDTGATKSSRKTNNPLEVESFGGADFSISAERRQGFVELDETGDNYEFSNLYQPNNLVAAPSNHSSSLLRLGLFGLLAVLVVSGILWAWQQWGAGALMIRTENAYLRSDMITITPQVTGQVVEVAVTEYQQVEAGDVLISIDNSSYLANRQKAEADIHAAEAALNNLHARMKLQRTRIDVSSADILTAQAELDYAQADSARYEALQGTGSSSIQIEQDAKATLAKAIAAHTRSESQLASAEQQLHVLASERQQHEADLARAQALLLLAVKDVKNTVIQAPRDGVIGLGGVQAGEYVQTGQSLMLLVPLNDIYVVANFSETQIANVTKGQRAAIEIDALGGREIAGLVASIAPATQAEFAVLPPENTTLAVMAGNDTNVAFRKTEQRIAVKIQLQVPDELSGTLRPGMSVVARVLPR
jgi:membrane fusion protein (multidrug efflux system)